MEFSQQGGSTGAADFLAAPAGGAKRSEINYKDLPKGGYNYAFELFELKEINED